MAEHGYQAVAGLRLDVLLDRTLHPLEGWPLSERLPISGGDREGLLTHSRFALGRRHITITAVEPETLVEPVTAIDEALFGGYLFAHYGHFLSETVPRLWPAIRNPRFANMKIVFAVSALHGGVTSLRPFMVDILAYLGLDPVNVLLLTTPLQVRRLHVAEPARGLGRLPPAGYDDVFKPLGPSADPDAGSKLYVTRSRHIFSGGYLGELLVDDVLAASGITVVVPEEHRVADLMRLYRAASHIVFSEGSAIHLVELSGGLDARVLVVGRRDPAFVEDQFLHSLTSLCGSAIQFPRLSALPPFKVDAEGRAEWSWSPAVIDIAALLERLADFYGKAIALPDRQQISRAMMLDLGRFALDPRSSGAANPRQTGQQLKKLRRQVAAQGLFDRLF